MEHIILKYDSDDISFEDKIIVANGRGGTLAIRACNFFNGTKRHYSETSVHLTKDQILALIADLAEQAAAL